LITCQNHGIHEHQHGPGCGHLKIQWADHVDYLHDGHLHHMHEGHWDEDTIAVSTQNPDRCEPTTCAGHHADAPMLPHGDHVDRLVNGRLHHEHKGHCDDHGPVTVLSK
jgi:hypothetical protein